MLVKYFWMLFDIMCFSHNIKGWIKEKDRVDLAFAIVFVALGIGFLIQCVF